MKPVKCLVWDLDHTLWDGTLLEDGATPLRPGMAQLLRELDQRGILLSIASKNVPDDVAARLAALELDHYFLYPQVGWQPKSQSLRQIAEELNIGIDAIAFIDDQSFELDEVRFALPEVRCYRADEAATLLGRPEFSPPPTPEAAMRRQLYQSDQARKRAEQDFAATPEAFLATLDMRLTLFHPSPGDLLRAEELTVRTHQLNTTGYTYSIDELGAMCASPRHLVLLARLRDRYGSYGTIGLAVVEMQRDAWCIKLLLMSCRVMSRGVGGALLNHLMTEARAAGLPLQAEFRATERNRMMYVTYRFAGFRRVHQSGDTELLQHDLDAIAPLPTYLTLELPEPATRLLPEKPELTTVNEPGALRILTGEQVAGLLHGAEDAILRRVQAAYEYHQRGDSVLPHSLFLRFPDQPRDRIIALPAYLGGDVRRAGLKWIASFPGNHDLGLDRASAVMLVNCARTGQAQAVLEGSIISMKRTAASAALAARHLHGGQPQGVALAGCGPINFETLRFLRTVFPGLRHAMVYDVDAERARAFQRQAEATHAGLEVAVAGSADQLWRSGWVLSYATTALEPHIHALPPGVERMTILNLSLRDFTPAFVQQVDNIVDDPDHVLRADTSLHLAEQQLGHRRFVRGTLAQVTLGELPARAWAGGVTMFSPFGLGILDLALADLVLQRAQQEGQGTVVRGFLPAAGLK